MADTNYEDLVKQAEQAVAPVKDPELKRIAFGKILDSLLGTPEAHRDLSRSKKAKGKIPVAAYQRRRKGLGRGALERKHMSTN